MGLELERCDYGFGQVRQLVKFVTSNCIWRYQKVEWLKNKKSTQRNNLAEVENVTQRESWYGFEIHENRCEEDGGAYRVYCYGDDLMEYYYDEGIEEKRCELSQQHEGKFELESWVEIV